MKYLSKIIHSADPEFGIGCKDGLAPAPVFFPHKSQSVTATGYSGIAINSDGFNCEFQYGFHNEKLDGHCPCACITFHLDDWYSALKTAHLHIRKHKDAFIAYGSLLPISPTWIESGKIPEQAWESGCNPTWNARTMQLCPVMPDYRDIITQVGVPLGCHAHIIGPFLYNNNIAKRLQLVVPFVKFATVVATLPMSLIGYDKSAVERFKLLGIGNFRMPRHHGVELKDFSGYTLKSFLHSAMQMGLVRLATSLYKTESPEFKSRIIKLFDKAVEALLSGDKDKVIKLVKKVENIIGELDLNAEKIAPFTKEEGNISSFYWHMVHHDELMRFKHNCAPGWGGFKIRCADHHLLGIDSFIQWWLNGRIGKYYDSNWKEMHEFMAAFK